MNEKGVTGGVILRELDAQRNDDPDGLSKTE
jgi:hypothetical protein